ncbi:hypothetical protein KEM48_006621 [Puccinia striiformis f. sp. tritici PST-130]|nr:hypothetical protein KEM48_006621 [Puccinia striiformis f. sp. tritici PST-130]
MTVSPVKFGRPASLTPRHRNLDKIVQSTCPDAVVKAVIGQPLSDKFCAFWVANVVGDWADKAALQPPEMALSAVNLCNNYNLARSWERIGVVLAVRFGSQNNSDKTYRPRILIWPDEHRYLDSGIFLAGTHHDRTISAALSLYSRDAYFPICVVDIARFAWWTPGSKVCAKTSDEQGTTTLRLAAIPGPDLWAAVAVTAGTRPRWSLTRQRHSATDLFSPHLHEEDTARNGTCLRVPSFRITDQIIGYVSL